MDTVTLISEDKKFFQISEYQAEKFTFLKHQAVGPIHLRRSGEILKLLFDHSEIYMNSDNEKIYDELVKYKNQIKTISNRQRFEIINAAMYLRYENIDSLIRIVKTC